MTWHKPGCEVRLDDKFGQVRVVEKFERPTGPLHPLPLQPVPSHHGDDPADRGSTSQQLPQGLRGQPQLGTQRRRSSLRRIPSAKSGPGLAVLIQQATRGLGSRS